MILRTYVLLSPMLWKTMVSNMSNKDWFSLQNPVYIQTRALSNRISSSKPLSNWSKILINRSLETTFGYKTHYDTWLGNSLPDDQESFTIYIHTQGRKKWVSHSSQECYSTDYTQLYWTIRKLKHRTGNYMAIKLVAHRN